MAALSAEDAYRLGSTLSRYATESIDQSHHFHHFTTSLADLLLNLTASVADAIAKRYQLKRKPSGDTMDRLLKIRAWRAEGISWARMDQRLGLKPGSARQIFRDSKKRGWK
jgi:hypothetical protein